MSASQIDVTLDAELRRFGRLFARRLGICTLIGAGLWLVFTAQTTVDLASAFGLGCTLGAACAVGRACRLGEAVGGRLLNHWDEALALNGLSIGTHILVRNLTGG